MPVSPKDELSTADGLRQNGESEGEQEVEKMEDGAEEVPRQRKKKKKKSSKARKAGRR